MVRVALQISYVESICYVFLSLPLVKTQGEEKLICGLRVADGRSVLLGEKGHPDSDFLLIFFNDRLQNRNKIFFPLGVLLAGYIATNLAQQIDVIHECGCPSTQDIFL